ncbi:MAG: DUF3575 domain-containing protein, partial [Muribaculaceae bacterium]|nr:DUF3575 domain-containing protein [Muribaculaceae bacterium]
KSSAASDGYQRQVEGYASPDGRVSSNLALAQRRTDALSRWLVEECGVDPVLVDRRQSAIAWDDFRRAISASGLSESGRILEICGEGSDDSQADVWRRMSRLKSLEGGRVWRILARDIFPKLRRSVSVLVTVRRELPVSVPEEVAVIEPSEERSVTDECVPEQSAPEPAPAVAESEESAAAPECVRGWHVSTNMPALGMFIVNAAVEYDFACRWSGAVSVYYSAWNYCTSTRKFRTFIFRPEVRYWFSDGHRGFFAEGHVAMSSYNFALSGWRYRIQDADGTHPALGGGLGLGWRLPLSRNGRWSAEAQIGAGCYALKYDRFENCPNGQLADTRSRTWFGIDNVAVSIVYNF